LFAEISKTPWKTFITMVLCLMFMSVEWSKAATEVKISEPSSALEMTFSGTGSKKTRLFTVEDGWKIVWETESPTFKLSAHGSARRPYVGPTNEREEAQDGLKQGTPLCWPIRPPPTALRFIHWVGHFISPS
jgi:hypothetical protein